VHCWANLQSVHGLCCYGNVMRTRNDSKCVLVVALCVVVLRITISIFCTRQILQTLCRRQGPLGELTAHPQTAQLHFNFSYLQYSDSGAAPTSRFSVIVPPVGAPLTSNSKVALTFPCGTAVTSLNVISVKNLLNVT